MKLGFWTGKLQYTHASHVALQGLLAERESERERERERERLAETEYRVWGLRGVGFRGFRVSGFGYVGSDTGFKPLHAHVCSCESNFFRLLPQTPNPKP